MGKETRVSPVDTQVKPIKKTALSKELSKHDKAGTLPNFRPTLTSAIEDFNGADRNGGSLLDVQRGVFNVLQGAAYRVSRVKYALDYHTHERDTNYPYLYSNFVKFTKIVIDLYKAIGVVDPKHFDVLDELPKCLIDQEAKLRTKIKNWTPEKAARHSELEAELLKQIAGEDGSHESPHSHSHKVEKRSAALLLKRMSTSFLAGPKWVKSGVGAFNKEKIHHASRRTMAYAEGFDEVDHSGDSELYLNHRERVLLDSNDETVGGSYIKVGFWYDVFMPRLLAACSVGAMEPEYKQQNPKASELNKWFAQEKKLKRFDKYGHDVLEGWSACSPEVKLNIKRAWRLVRHYLVGPQKLRERSGDEGADHRESGDLSQYVVFIDVFLGKRYVEKSAMRITFPYFIGPTTWTWHHMVAERAAQWHATSTTDSMSVVTAMKEYFRIFVTMYPCPYCRHHLNEFVVQNREVELYPVEYILLGWTPSSFTPDFVTTVDDKLAYITDGLKLRLFVWKLHNAVSASIERSESWYKPADSVNTSRYWPSIEATLHRASYRSGVVATNRVSKIVDVLENAMHLAVLRESIIDINEEHINEMQEMVEPLIAELDKSIVASGFLQDCFSFKAGLVDAVVDATGMDENFIRHEHFTLN